MSETQNKTPYVREHDTFNIYKPNKAQNGAASSWEYSKGCVFLGMSNQVPGEDSNGNSQFDWKANKITVKLGPTDIGEILTVLSGQKETLGYNGKGLYHESEKGNKIVQLQYSKEHNSYYLTVSFQSADKTQNLKCGHPVSLGEGAVLNELLKKAVINIHRW